jgi:HK97 family phage prohead protease
MDKAKKRTLTLDNLEIRAVPQDNGPEKQTISGYAAVYNSESELMYGFFREVIKPGAFDSSLKMIFRALWNHDSAYVLGRTTSGTLDIRSDAKGLYFEVTPPETTWANDLVESIKRGDINQMSFGFTVNEDSWQSLEDGTEMRELMDVNLFEVSVVTFPGLLSNISRGKKHRSSRRRSEGSAMRNGRKNNRLDLISAFLIT